MALSPVIQKSFDNWINSNTWHTGDTNDEARFYVFVWSVIRFSRKRPTEHDVRELILERMRDRFDPEYLKEIALKHSMLYATLLDFASARKLGMPTMLISSNGETIHIS